MATRPVASAQVADDSGARPASITRKLGDTIAQRRDWARNLPGRTLLKLANMSRVRAHLGRRYAAALDRHRPALPVLDARQREIVDGLERDGVFVTSLDALGVGDPADLLRDAKKLADDFAAEARLRVANGADFVYVPSERIAADPTLFGWGVDDRLMDIVETYLGLPVAYDGVCLNYTVADGREVSTRRWHRDWEDRRMLKIAVYLNDVDGDGGPFQLIRRADPAQNDLSGFSYQLADDRELARRLGGVTVDDAVSCEGPAGTVFFADTARFFHRGKPATARDRAALFYSYFSQKPRHPFFCERSGMTRGEIRRLAEELPPRGRAASLWRDRLPVVLRMIPPASL